MEDQILKSLEAVVATIKTPQTILGVLVVSLVTWTRFNTWTEREKKEGYGSDNPPRVYTTWMRYVSGAAVYVISLELVYLGFVVMPDLLRILSKSLSFDLPQGALTETKNLPLWILVIMIGLLPRVPGLKELESWWRYSVHRRAFIPAQAQALVQTFVVKPDLFRPDREQATKVLEALSDELPAQVNALDPRKQVAHGWFKLSYLRKKIQDWQGQPEVSRFFSECRREYALCDETYARLRTDVKLYFERDAALAGQSLSVAERDYQNTRQKVILDEINKLLRRTYEFISCGILATERSEGSRHRAFQHFDLSPEFTPIIIIPVVLDVILECAIAVFAITMITTLIYLFGQSGKPASLGLALRWSFISLLLQALGILGSVLFYRGICRRMRSATGVAVCGPVVQVSLGALVGYVIGLVVLMSYLYSYASLAPQKYWTIVLSWSLIPAGTSGFIVFYLLGLRPARWWWSEGALQALVMGSVALLSYSLVRDALGAPWRIEFATYAVATCGLAGLAIGLIFPGQYRRFVADAYRGPELRSHRRQFSGAMSTLKVGTEHYACETVDISLSGAKTTADASDDVGTPAILELQGIGALQGVIARRTEGMTCVRFSLDEARQRGLSSYLAQHR